MSPSLGHYGPRREDQQAVCSRDTVPLGCFMSVSSGAFGEAEEENLPQDET